MGCNCGGTPAGYTRKFELVRPGERTQEFADKAAALTAKQRAGGGRVQAKLVRNKA